MPAPLGQSCGNCQNCVTKGASAECHGGRPVVPSPQTRTDLPGTRWPPVQHDEWCADWKAISG